jgi:hypothetical protein
MAKQPRATTARTSQPIKPQVVLDSPLSVTAGYATMFAILSTETAVRISFGEASSSGNRFHSAVAIDFSAAEKLRDELTKVIDQRDRGEIQSLTGVIVDG